MVPGTARLVLLYEESDAEMARGLERLFAVLERQGLVEPWSPRRIPAGQQVDSAIEQHIARADIVLLTVSADFAASDRAAGWIKAALHQRRVAGARVIPVLLRPSLVPPELAALSALPRNQQPISTWPDRDEALLDVVEGVRTVLEYRPREQPEEQAPRDTVTGAAPSRSPAPAPPSTDESAQALPIHQIFRLDGPPDITFVEPSQFP
ncbi:MAG TPA: toll/interleukin-1 receptor domain-containing protein, partial [Candidatus Nanopelagicales bacterium]|nr:toll/interleukin-1 receptor domain-containing protein [Candidatus Nanopelagicales bacterium]